MKVSKTPLESVEAHGNKQYVAEWYLERLIKELK